MPYYNVSLKLYYLAIIVSSEHSFSIWESVWKITFAKTLFHAHKQNKSEFPKECIFVKKSLSKRKIGQKHFVIDHFRAISHPSETKNVMSVAIFFSYLNHIQIKVFQSDSRPWTCEQASRGRLANGDSEKEI